MAFPQARERLQAAISARLGEPANWSGVAQPVQVRFAERDEVAGLGGTELLIAALVLRVRCVDVPTPSVDDVVFLETSGRQLRVTAEPRLDANGVWAAPVEDI